MENDTSKNVLFISYYFPPSGGGGVKRPTKFVKYLRRFNWNAIGFTVPVESLFLLDEKHLKDLPADIKIIRARTLISKKQTDNFRLKSLKGTAVTNKNIRGLKNKILWKIRDWFFIPDVQITWLIFALPKALKAINTDHIKAVYTKCPPYSVLVLGALLKMFKKVPWVIDLADPWTTASYNYFPNQRIKRINEILEKKLFRFADKIITVADNIVDDYKIKYPDLDYSKFHVIPNGFDKDDMHNLNATPYSKFTICYTGRLDVGGRDPANFLQAVAAFIHEQPAAKDNLQILFVGAGGEYWQPMLRENGLQDIVKFTGNVSHDKCIEYQLKSHVLLLIGGGSKYEQTGKIFEYIVSEKPVLGLIRSDSPAAEIINTTQTGIVIPNEDPGDIQEQIAWFYFKFQNKENLWTGWKQDEIRRYDWENHAHELAAIFDDLNRI